jgi:hypothetical protein
MVLSKKHYCYNCEFAIFNAKPSKYEPERIIACDKYSQDYNDLPEAMALCIQDKQRYLLLNISRKIAKLDANYEQPK